MTRLGVLFALFLGAMIGLSCAQEPVGTRIFESSVLPNQVNAVAEKGFLNQDGNLYTYYCKPAGIYNPRLRTDVPEIVERPIYFQGYHYVVIASQLWRVDSDDQFVNTFSNRGFPPKDFQTTSTHIVYFVETLTQFEMRYSTNATGYGITTGLPKKISKVFISNDKAFISTPGNAYAFDGNQNAAVLLYNFCNTTNGCESPTDFVSDGTSFYFKAPAGILKTDGKGTAATSIWCDLTLCLNTVALASHGKEVYAFSKSGNDLVMFKISDIANSITQMAQFSNSNVELRSRFRWVSSDKFYFFINNANTPNCTEIWSTSGTVLSTNLMASACYPNSSYSLTIRNVQEPATMNYIYFQAIISSPNETFSEMWEFNKVSRAVKSIATICSTLTGGCNPEKEYYQTLTPTCIAHWAKDGFYIRSTSDINNPDSASTAIFSIYLLILSIVLSFFYY